MKTMRDELYITNVLGKSCLFVYLNENIYICNLNVEKFHSKQRGHGEIPGLYKSYVCILQSLMSVRFTEHLIQVSIPMRHVSIILLIL